MNNRTILIAEDDEGHAFLIKRNLIRSGINNPIRHFYDGQQLLDFLYTLVELNHVNLSTSFVIVLDIRMPKMNGIEVLEKIRTNEHLRELPVIILTTTDDPREFQLCKDLGCTSYLVKPMDYESFVATIRQLSEYITTLGSKPDLN